MRFKALFFNSIETVSYLSQFVSFWCFKIDNIQWHAWQLLIKSAFLSSAALKSETSDTKKLLMSWQRTMQTQLKLAIFFHQMLNHIRNALIVGDMLRFGYFFTISKTLIRLHSDKVYENIFSCLFFMVNWGLEQIDKHMWKQAPRHVILIFRKKLLWPCGAGVKRNTKKANMRQLESFTKKTRKKYYATKTVMKSQKIYSSFSLMLFQRLPPKRPNEHTELKTSQMVDPGFASRIKSLIELKSFKVCEKLSKLFCVFYYLFRY